MAVPPYITVTYDPPLPSDTGAGFSAKAFDTVAKFNPWSTAANGLADYVNDRADEALATALGGDLPPLTGQALKYLRVNAGETAAEFAAIPAPVELSPTQVEDDTSTVFGQVSGERLDQKIVDRFNLTGTAPTYACRAWVNFNGTGTVAIRASGNVSSITDNGTGDYTVNFTTAMPDADYTVIGSGQETNSADGGRSIQIPAGYTPTTSAFRVIYKQGNGSEGHDSQRISISVFR